MRQKPAVNPFGAPVYYRETVSSTMDESRALSRRGEPHGTVIAADFQEAGRGRTGRSWEMERGQNLSFTILLRYGSIEAVPAAITLRAGLAVSYAVEDFAPLLQGRVAVKWPNDVMICGADTVHGKKAAGILTESDGQTVYIGIGVNVGQKTFPPELEHKATSIARAAPAEALDPRLLLEHILARLYRGLEPGFSWREALEQRLYMRGMPVRFAPGEAGSGKLVEGTLAGIGAGGELLILRDGEAEAFVTGELLVYGAE